MKHIISNFMGGLSSSDKNAPENTYYEGREVDIYRDPGYLKPGYDLTVITSSTSNPQIIDAMIVDIVFYQNKGYLISSNGKVYEIHVGTNGFNSDFYDSGYDYDIPGTGIVNGYKVAIYDIGGSPYLLFAHTDYSAGDVGTYNLSDTFNPDYLSTDIATGAGALEIAPIDMMEWKSLMYISHGQYVGRLNGADEAWDRHKLDLGDGWQITKLFPAEHFVGICAWRKNITGDIYRTESRIFFWDGSSEDWSYWKPITANKILTAMNKDGEVLIFAKDGQGTTLRRLTDFGTDIIKRLKFSLTGSYTGTIYPVVRQNALDVYRNRVLFGAGSLVGSYGEEEEGQPNAITLPYGRVYNSYGSIGVIKNVFASKVYYGYYDGTNYHLLRTGSDSSTHAKYRANYVDLGQKAQINYVKFYFKPLSSGDTADVKLDINNGTTVDLGTISYAGDGEITSKAFKHKHPFCHAFRPTIEWNGGGMAVSKIVIDYSIIGD
jgi:hypothetical protein